MIRNTLRALVSYVITLPGIFLLVGLLTNAEASWWLICAVALVFTCAMFLLHGGRKTPVRRRGRRGGPEMRLADTTPAAAATAEIEAPMVDGSGGGSMAVGETVAAVMAGETAAGTDPLR